MPDSKSSSLYSIKLEATQRAEENILHRAQADPVSFALYHLKFEPDPGRPSSSAPGPRGLFSTAPGSRASPPSQPSWHSGSHPQTRSTIVLDSPSLRQSQELMLKFSEFLAMVDRNVKLDSDTKLSYASRTAPGPGPPGSEKTIRGISAVTLLILDEAAGIPDELYGAVRPMLAGLARPACPHVHSARGAGILLRDLVQEHRLGED